MIDKPMILRFTSRSRRRWALFPIYIYSTLLEMRPRDTLLLLQREEPSSRRLGVFCLCFNVSNISISMDEKMDVYTC